jgi:anthranilate synthase component 2
MHGKTDAITHTGVGVFENLPTPFTVTRYHSLAIDRKTIPACLEITAQSPDGEIMGVRHRELPIEGVQFHPESILSEQGHALLKNFLQLKAH